MVHSRSRSENGKEADRGLKPVLIENSVLREAENRWEGKATLSGTRSASVIRWS